MIVKTIILPGYSLHNQDWAEDIAKDLILKTKTEVIVHNWRHWKDSSLNLSLGYEIEKILEEIGAEKVNIIAKSVGVAVAFELIPKIFDKVNKVILCGIASVSEDRAKNAELVFSKLPIVNVLCIQNEKDKFVIYEEAKNFYHSINPDINIISKPRSDHDYPYQEDFIKFLKD